MVVRGRRTTGGRGVLEGALVLLDELATVGEAGPALLAARTGLPKATAHRLLDQLVVLGAAHRDEGRYRIGPRLFRYGAAWRFGDVLRAAARDPLRRLAGGCRGASVNVAVPESGRTLVVTGLRGEADEILSLRPGVLAPHGNAGDRLFAIDEPAPPPARYSGQEWTRLVGMARDRGIAYDYADSGYPVSAVGAPVRARDGRIVAGVGVLVLDGRRLTAFAPAARRAADEISANLARLAGADPVLASWLDGA